jgi:high-affinity Fe2+/Pb2+ permease
VSTELLTSNDKGIRIQARRLISGIVKYAVEMGSGATIYIQSFIKAGSAIQKLKEGGVFRDTNPHRHPDRKVIS